ncbi:hypothetical protein [Actinotalea sp.]|uniref:hypothetical protein n=1 Tax=Actinotalea sp. TaxID=1872145 RepID=UPI002B7CA8E2|nr:hypothetical protein [Actinotalea sp.]HQY32729.1 hypothetical protein [Actinotalea sp.]HRA50287.1 hypothetical protein [Actinotalea sp.]
MHSPLRTAFAAVLLTATVLVAAPAAAAPLPEPTPGEGEGTQTPQDLVSFGISPAGVDRPDQRPYLAMTAPAGAVVYEHAALINQDDVPVSLEVYGADVIMAEGGGLAVRAKADPSTDAGSWISIEGPTTIEVPAQTPETGFGYAVVPFTVTIPTNAEPGDHVAGFIASLVSVGAGGENSPSIQLEQRVAARVYIRVQGELDPDLALSDVVATWLPGSPFESGSVRVEYTLTNTGNVRMAVEPSVGVAGPFGLLPRSADGTRVDELMPGGQTRLTTVVEDVWPLIREAVTIDATAVAAAGGQDPGIGTVTASVQLWAVPWVVLGILLALLALLVALVLRRRARRAAPPAQGGRRARRTGAPGPVVPVAPVVDVAAAAPVAPGPDADLPVPRVPAASGGRRAHR